MVWIMYLTWTKNPAVVQFCRDTSLGVNMKTNKYKCPMTTSWCQVKKTTLGYCRLAFETKLRKKSKYNYLLVQMILTRTNLDTNATVHIILRESLENNGCCVSWVGFFYMTSEVLHPDRDRSLYLEYGYNFSIVPTWTMTTNYRYLPLSQI